MEKGKGHIKRKEVSKRTLLWILIVAVWLFVILKMLAGALFEKHTSLVSAFSVTDPGLIEATVEVTARFPEEYLDSFDKKQMLWYMAKEIRLEPENAPTVETTEQRQEISYFKEADAANTTLRIVSLREETEEGEEFKHYLYAKITLKKSIESLPAYKELLEDTFAKLNGTEISTTLRLVGEFEGYLTMDRKNEVTDRILAAMNANTVYEHREEDLYTVYAYTAALDRYITVEKKKINVHIAMSSDEENYRTILYLASPILPDTW